MNLKIYQTKIGNITIVEEDNFITNILFGAHVDDLECVVEETPAIKNAIDQINKYLDGKLKKFDVPVKIEGTSFTSKVLKAMIKIPYGQTITYKELATQAGNFKAARAVGMIANKNKIPIIIPCHRVIGSNGSLTGYGGGLDIKKLLLSIEGAIPL